MFYFENLENKQLNEVAWLFFPRVISIWDMYVCLGIMNWIYKSTLAFISCLWKNIFVYEIKDKIDGNVSKTALNHFFVGFKAYYFDSLDNLKSLIF